MPETLECNDKIIKYLSSEEVSSLIKQSNYKNSNELKDIDKSDLIPNIYEGKLIAMMYDKSQYFRWIKSLGSCY